MFERAKLLHVEALQPGLQFFPSSAEYQGTLLAEQQHRASESAASQVAGFVAPALTLAAGALFGPEATFATGAIQDTLIPEDEGGGMLDWLSSGWETVTGWFGGSAGEPDFTGMETGGFDPGGFDMTGGGVAGGTAWPEVGGEIWERLPGLVEAGVGNGGGDIIPAMGTLPRAGQAIIGGATMAGSAVGGLTLASVLGAGRAAATFTINGIRGTMPQLWKYTRKYGAPAVANALGITVGALGAMLLSAPDAGRRRRRRGISARDIRTTKRVVGFVSKMAHDIGCVRAPRHFTRRRARA